MLTITRLLLGAFRALRGPTWSAPLPPADQSRLYCPQCRAPFLCPIDWGTFGDDQWWVLSRCGECGDWSETLISNEQAARLDIELNRQQALIRRATERLEAERMAVEAEAFIVALQRDLIDAADFGVVLPDGAAGVVPDDPEARVEDAAGMFNLRHNLEPVAPPAGDVPAIEVRGLVKVFGAGGNAVRALDGVDLVVRRGEMVAIMGPSGSGKSTLLHIVGALESASDGTIAVAGQRYDGLDDAGLTRLRREHIGFVFQFFNLLSSLTAEENVLLPALIARRTDRAIRERAHALLDLVGLGARATHTPGELSGGQQQRVSIARALLLEPELVLADEPTGNLDSKSGREVLRVLRELNRAEGRTILMVTHDASAAAVADRVVFLRDGRHAGEVEGGSTQRVIDFLATLEPSDDLAAEPAASAA